MKRKTTGRKGRSQRVRFEFNAQTAEAVFIAGTFNDWRPEASPMIALGRGRWAKDLALSPGRYAYRFVVDGRWMPDPLATESTPNPFGGEDSIRRVANGE